VPDFGTLYDQVLYPGNVYHSTHPDFLATCARLRNLDPAPPENCRVLEIGCGDGTNLIAMAAGLAESEFVGIDSSERATSAGRALSGELGLRNVTLEHADLRALEDRLGRFDYVISHGVYSWVPPDVQDALLAACKKFLAPKGVAYVSYSTYPGAHTRELVREMMLFHAGQELDPLEKVKRGIEFLRFVREAQTQGGSTAAMLDDELARLNRAAPEYVFHDDFSEFSIPVYFAAFVEHAATHGLKFLAESHFAFFEDPNLPANVRTAIAGFSGGDPIAEEQYLDFVRGTAFRRTLLCHDEVELPRRGADPNRVLSLYAASSLTPQTAPIDPTPRDLASFVGLEGQKIETDEPLAKATMLALAETWPQAIRVEQLLTRAEALAGLGACDPGERSVREELVAKLILRLAAFKVLYLSSHAPRFATSPGERPCASALSRAQARRGPFVTSQRHLQVRLEDEPARRLLLLLDGTRTRSDLLADLAGLCAELGDPQPKLTPSHLDQLLSSMAAHGLLIA
jgi:SAM-dependent methyltransferase